MTVSLVEVIPGQSVQARHLLVSMQFNLYRCALSGMWPLRICMSRLLCALDSPCKIILNFVNGKDLSMHTMRTCLGELPHCSAHIILTSCV